MILRRSPVIPSDTTRSDTAPDDSTPNDTVSSDTTDIKFVIDGQRLPDNLKRRNLLSL